MDVPKSFSFPSSLFFLVFLLSVLESPSAAASAESWKSRTLYQIFTDRFSKTKDDFEPCDNLANYCGGTFNGISNHLDYILGMGFDAIWISPVVENYENGYHGYWMTDLYSVNSKFGLMDDLKDLVKKCHEKHIMVMVDIVANHVGPVGYTYDTIIPFNSSMHYHDCSECPQVETCRLAGLPDLNQSHSFVHSKLIEWVHWLIDKYDFDGIRVDTVPEVHAPFWREFAKSSGVFSLGEVYDGRVDYVAGYTDYLDSVVSYPLFFVLRSVFVNGESMNKIEETFTEYASNFKHLDLLGNFIDNHDQTRFLHEQTDIVLYKNALLCIQMFEGIPIVYYGTEQEFNGGADPYNREALWESHYNESSELYIFLKSVITFRKKNDVYKLIQTQRYSDDKFYAFTRGDIFVALTNGGSSQLQLQRTITYHPYSDGTRLCNLFWQDDCVSVENGQFIVFLRNGECKLYYPDRKFL